MILFKKATDLRNYLDAQALKGKSIGFVPTMGALHEGHISLVNASRKQNTITVCSLFVNPTQFNNADDLKKYPVSIEKDIHLLESSGCDILFMPAVSEMYPDGLETSKTYELGYLETILEGKFRPGHFQGVCRIVDLLLGIVNPQRLYLGQKDYQQCLVIKRLFSLTNRSQIELIICPTLREDDGLAMSSRNRRLNSEERLKAPLLFATLLNVKNEFSSALIPKLREKAIRNLEEHGFKVDYIEIANADDLHPANGQKTQKLVVLGAAFLNEIRLIDNLTLN